MHQHRLMFVCIAACFLISATASAADVPELNKDNFAKWRDYIRPSEKELAYLKIPWRTSLGPAIAEAKAKKKPILLWNYNGNPFGCGRHNGVISKEVFGDSKIQELCKDFIPVAEDAWRLDVEDKYPGHEFFRKAHPQGGQGVYVLTPSGKLLGQAEWNGEADLLRTSLKTWDTLSAQEKNTLAKGSGGAKQENKLYPSSGLVLHSYSRDLPRSSGAQTTHKEWNQDFVWFQKDEAKQFLPPVISADQKREVPQFLVYRLARFHLVDNVRGQTRDYEPDAVKIARLSSHITSIKQGIAYVEFSGESRTDAEGQWGVDGQKDIRIRKRGYEARLLGNAQYKISQQKFVSFELVACGTRYGGTEYNFRFDDVGPAPIGTAFVLAGKEPAERIKPAHLGGYNWQTTLLRNK
jgi:hypothetical protein